MHCIIMLIYSFSLCKTDSYIPKINLMHRLLIIIENLQGQIPHSDDFHCIYWTLKLCEK